MRRSFRPCIAPRHTAGHTLDDVCNAVRCGLTRGNRVKMNDQVQELNHNTKGKSETEL